MWRHVKDKENYFQTSTPFTTHNETVSTILVERRAVCNLFANIPSPASLPIRRHSFNCETNHQTHEGSISAQQRARSNKELEHNANQTSNYVSHTQSFFFGYWAVNAISLLSVDCMYLLSSAEPHCWKRDRRSVAEVRPKWPDTKFERERQTRSHKGSLWDRARQISVPHPTQIDENSSRHTAEAKTVNLLPSTEILLR